MPFLAVGAIAGAVATTAFAVSATTLAYISVGLAVVGKLTKSKELSQIGAGLSFGAGIGSLFAGAAGGAAGAAGEVVNGGVGAVSEAGFDAWAAGQGAAESAVGLDAFGGATASFETAGLAAQPGTTGLIGAAPAPLATQPPAFDAVAANAPTQPTAASATTAQAPSTTVSTVSGAVTPPPDTTSFGIKNWWSGLTDAQKNNVMQIGGKAAEGLFAGWSAEQKNALERERLNLEQQRYATQTANANAQPVVSYKPVGGLLSAGAR